MTKHEVVDDVVGEPFKLLRFKSRLILIPLVQVGLACL